MARSNARFLDPRATAQLPEGRRWSYPRAEPTAHELLADPIAHLLMRADKLTPHEVVAVLRAARPDETQGVEA
jgi:hypothetical protein